MVKTLTDLLTSYACTGNTTVKILTSNLDEKENDSSFDHISLQDSILQKTLAATLRQKLRDWLKNSWGLFKASMIG